MVDQHRIKGWRKITLAGVAPRPPLFLPSPMLSSSKVAEMLTLWYMYFASVAQCRALVSGNRKAQRFPENTR